MNINLNHLATRLNETGLMNKSPAEMKTLEIKWLCEIIHESTNNKDGWTPPYISGNGDLIIPFNAPAKYRYWAPGGQSIKATLKELGANSDMIERYAPARLSEGRFKNKEI